MKTRIISAIILAAILVPILMFGGIIFNIFMYLISMLALNEFLNVKEEKKKLTLFIKILCFVMLALTILGINALEFKPFTIDFRIISALFIIMLIPIIMYNDKNKYSVNDAFFLIGSILFLSFSFANIIYLRSINLTHIIYIVLVAMITDSYAYFGGYLIGKHKLTSISPKKTWEGSIIGTVFCTFVGSMYYYNFVNSNVSIFIIIAMTLLLSIISQFGDLTFSAIKRYFGKKDFSNLIPGHGGILDRLDSIIFVVLGYIFLIIII